VIVSTASSPETGASDVGVGAVAAEAGVDGSGIFAVTGGVEVAGGVGMEADSAAVVCESLVKSEVSGVAMVSGAGSLVVVDETVSMVDESTLEVLVVGGGGKPESDKDDVGAAGGAGSAAGSVVGVAGTDDSAA
jgi:hypothetical protein